VDGAGDEYFWGTIGFFCGARKKIRSSPLRQHRSVVDGGTPRGGVPPRGDPPLGGPPPLIKDRFFRKIRKRRCTKPVYAHFGPQKPCFWGGTQNDRFWPFVGVLGGIPGIPPYRGRFEKQIVPLLGCLRKCNQPHRRTYAISEPWSYSLTNIVRC